jgi:hypothetical protein
MRTFFVVAAIVGVRLLSFRYLLWQGAGDLRAFLLSGGRPVNKNTPSTKTRSSTATQEVFEIKDQAQQSNGDRFPSAKRHCKENAAVLDLSRDYFDGDDTTGNLVEREEVKEMANEKSKLSTDFSPQLKHECIADVPVSEGAVMFSDD